MSDQLYLNGTKAGTIGGTLIVIFANIAVAEMIKTAFLAAIGAVVSFIISVLMNWVMKKMKKKKKYIFKRRR
jgi:mannitol-specific phosphotransferase system IIBC component